MNQAALANDPIIQAARRGYIMDFDEYFNFVFGIIDVPKLTFFEVIEKLRENKINSIDPLLVKSIIEAKLTAHFKDFSCPKCGKRISQKRKDSRKLVTTIGTFSIKSPYYYCAACKAGFRPFDRILNLRPGNYQYDIQKVVVKISSGQTFEESAEIINDIYGLKISAEVVHNLTQEFAGEVELSEIIPSKDEVHKAIEECSKGKTWRPVVVFSADGAMAPIRTEQKSTPHCWKEAKGFRIFLMDEDHIIHLVSWHQIGSKETLCQALEQVKSKNLFPESKVRMCCVADGADWIWDSILKYFPNCRQVLDYYHCIEHLNEFASEKFENKKLADQWIASTKFRLFHNNIKDVISGLKRMQCQGDLDMKRNKLVNYLSKNIHRLDYGAARKGKYPIGSGAIESANRFICHTRLKKSGAWWKIDYANNILKLRCARYNKKFDTFFALFEQNQRERLEMGKPCLRAVN